MLTWRALEGAGALSPAACLWSEAGSICLQQPKLALAPYAKLIAPKGLTVRNCPTQDSRNIQVKSMLYATENRYIVRNEEILGGEPIIKGTRTPVRAIVESWRQGVLPEDIPRVMPHLTLAQVFDALSYYSEHQQEINSFIEHNRIPEELIDPLVRDV